MDESLRAAVELFNAARFTEFQDALETMVARTRASVMQSIGSTLPNAGPLD